MSQHVQWPKGSQIPAENERGSRHTKQLHFLQTKLLLRTTQYNPVQSQHYAAGLSQIITFNTRMTTPYIPSFALL